ncbi:MAG TPA: CDGSH iron-sulfur domain-containing protein [Rhizobiales bacterium]|nr:CDGSH iron-sulfur domain-containing protein [Hyphomicrobiales bacterium]
MPEVKIAARIPSLQKLEAGKEYWWCACGRSKTQPFCDGSHEGTGFEPLKVTVEQSRNYALCQCKHTKTPPFCDGSHKDLA